MQTTPEVRRVMLAEGVSQEELELMVRKAVINTSFEGYNRRFHNWLFSVKGEEVLKIRGFEDKKVGKDRGKGFMHEECEVCEGEGCRACSWVGEVKRFI